MQQYSHMLCFAIMFCQLAKKPYTPWKREICISNNALNQVGTLIVHSEKLIAAFHDGWNDGDVDGLMRLTTADCIHFDAYFADVVTSWNLAEYLEDDIKSANVRYRVSEIIECTAELASYKYFAQILDDDRNVIGSYDGVERLRLRDGKIRRMTDLYVAPPELLSSYYFSDGAQTDKSRCRPASDYDISEILQCRTKLNRMMRNDCPYRDPDVTLAKIANLVGHTEDLILLVLDIDFNRDFTDFLDKCRLDSAREMINEQVLAGHLDTDLGVDKRIAERVGFKTHAQFASAFKKAFHLTPRQCRRTIRNQQLANLKAA